MTTTEHPHWSSRLQAKWGLSSVFQVMMVLIVFSCAGMSVVLAKTPLFEMIGFTEETSTWLKVGVYLVTILPMYQVFLLFYALVLGQFHFFWGYQKKSLARLGRLFKRS